MRLVRGSILSSEPCSTSKAARILRRFLHSDGGTDVSVKSFLKSAARSLESMGEGGHSGVQKSKRKKRRLEFETNTEFVNPIEGLSGSGLDPPQQPSPYNTTDLEDEKKSKKREKISKVDVEGHSDGRVEVGVKKDFVDIAEKKATEFEDGKQSKKRQKTSKANAEGHPDDKLQVGVKQDFVGIAEQKTEDKKHANKSKKKHTVQEGGETEKLEKVDSDLYTAPTVESRSEKMAMENGVCTDAAGTLASASKQSKLEISGGTEKKRKKVKKHLHKESDDGGLRDLHVGEGKTELELNETPATNKKKSKKQRSPDHLDDSLVLSSSKISDQGKHFVKGAEEGDYDHSRLLKREVSETTAEVIADAHSTKKKKERQNSKVRF